MLYARLTNDFYAKDTSKKVRAVMKAKGLRGEHLNRPPYGYLDDPEQRGHWIIDPETAPVVKRIYDLAMSGKGPRQIAFMLRREQVPTPAAVYRQRHGKQLPEYPYSWSDTTTADILERMEYTGCTCSFKTYSKSYKLKKRMKNKPEALCIVENTQEAIVPKEQWDRVQELRQERHRTVRRAKREGMFAGIVFCADCGRRMHFTTCRSFEGKQDHYVCAAYKNGRDECSCHYIREDVLRKIVLERIRAVTAYVREDALGFQEEWMQSTRDAQVAGIRQNQKQLAQAKKRLADVDRLMTRLYEDHVLGDLSDERYRKMTADYEAEQERLKTEIAVTEEWIDRQQENADHYDRFAALVEKYVDIPELTTGIVNEFIKKIIVHEADKSSGRRRQTVEIVFNFVGQVEIPILTAPITTETHRPQRKTA